MPRKGRETELILKELESISLMGQAVVKSPDYIFDVVAGKKREVDISIRNKVGTHEFLTIIECRNRKEKGGIDWIEQIITKTANINTNRVIAVSTSGFTDGAINKAKHYNIILRTLRDFKAEEVKKWMDFFIVEEGGSKFKIIDIFCRFINIELDDDTKKKGKTIEFQIELNEKAFKIELTGEYVSLADIIMQVNDKYDNYLFNGLKEEDNPVTKKIQIVPENRILFDFDDITYYVKYMNIILECWIEPYKPIMPVKTVRYEENSKSLLEKADYKLGTDTISFTKDPESQKLIVKTTILLKK